MKVLVVWEELPENTSYYLLEGEDAQIAIAACGQLINGSDNWDQAGELNNILANYTAIDTNVPLDITGVDRVILSGWVM